MSPVRYPEITIWPWVLRLFEWLRKQPNGEATTHEIRHYILEVLTVPQWWEAVDLYPLEAYGFLMRRRRGVTIYWCCGPMCDDLQEKGYLSDGSGSSSVSDGPTR